MHYKQHPCTAASIEHNTPRRLQNRCSVPYAPFANSLIPQRQVRYVLQPLAITLPALSCTTTLPCPPETHAS